MNPELLVAAMLADPAIVALVGNRVALKRLPQNTQMPAIVYRVVTGVPQPNLNHLDKPRARVRVQINPIAPSVGEVKGLHAAVRAAMDFRHNTSVAGKSVISCTLASMGEVDRDDEAGLWTQPADYLLTYQE